ncbi:uncharacterized protein RCO7_03852 [Rhynchosporium graminicola]|uniref:NAD(P)-binding protein n=1 Tax=Rhynchosporium graminicola TaxID=2792576 RepID=A0A1E1LLW3_9HELO|nr:uncharacterized protein RCO7_03852 [Rhynchosporium commune]
MTSSPPVHRSTKTVYHDQYPSINVTRDSFSQEGKVILVTGASQGLGRKAFAGSFAKEGARPIIIIARNAAELEENN